MLVFDTVYTSSGRIHFSDTCSLKIFCPDVRVMSTSASHSLEPSVADRWRRVDVTTGDGRPGLSLGTVCRVHFDKRLRKGRFYWIGYDHTVVQGSELGRAAEQAKAKPLAENATRLGKELFRDGLVRLPAPDVATTGPTGAGTTPVKGTSH